MTMKREAFVNSKSVAASVSYLMELGADIHMWRYQDIGPSCFITLLCSSLRHDEYHDFRKMASKTTFQLQRLDLDEDGEVTVEEFLQACTQDKTIR